MFSLILGQLAHDSISPGIANKYNSMDNPYAAIIKFRHHIFHEGGFYTNYRLTESLGPVNQAQHFLNDMCHSVASTLSMSP